MKTVKFQNNKINLENSKISGFNNNAIPREQVTKATGGNSDFIITEDCIDM